MYASDAFCSILINISWNRYFQNSHVCRTQTNITFINKICLWQVLKKFQVFPGQAGTHLILNSYHSSSFFFFLNQSQQTQQGEKGGFPSPNWPAASCCWSLGHITPSAWNSFLPTPTLTLSCTGHVHVFPSITCSSYSSFMAKLRSYFFQKVFLGSSPSQTGLVSALWEYIDLCINPIVRLITLKLPLYSACLFLL